ncbi:MAG: rod shape-determining protein [Promethearchaeota archaeon]
MSEMPIVMEKMSMMPIIIDNGSGYSKNGFAGEEIPQSVFPTLVGYPKENDDLVERAYYVGKEAMEHQQAYDLNLVKPIEHSLIWDWEALEKIWHYTFFRDLRVDPTNHPVLLMFTERTLNTSPPWERIVEIMFETFNVPALYITFTSALSLYACGLSTGLIVDIGAQLMQIVPIYEGYSLSHAICHVDLAGHDLTNYLNRLLRLRGYNFVTPMERETVRDIKEQLCYVALDPEKELMRLKKAGGISKQYMLPNGAPLTLDHERFEVPEVLFNPAIIGQDHPPLHELIFETIEKCDPDLQVDLFRNIVLVGGSTLFDGLKERLTQELNNLISDSYFAESKIISGSSNYDRVEGDKIVAPPNRHHIAWTGGSILGSDLSLEKWVTKQDYINEGAAIIHRYSTGGF